MILGVDIGGTTSKLGLVREGRVVAHARINTVEHQDEHAFAAALCTAATEMAIDQDVTISAIGIGAPNANQQLGIIEMAPNLPWKHDVPLARMMAERMAVPVILGNDANAAALGEWRYGAGRGFNDLIIVTLGTGVGSGFIVNGALVLGSAGNAGELGHVIIMPDGRPCTCGRSGCLEAYVSIRGIRRTYAEELGSDQYEEHIANGVLSIAQAARTGEPAAIAAFDRTARWLAIGVANAVCSTGPERIVLFGGIARNSDLLMPVLLPYFDEFLLNIYKGRVDIVVSALPDDDAALLGAAALTTL